MDPAGKVVAKPAWRSSDNYKDQYFLITPYVFDCFPCEVEVEDVHKNEVELPPTARDLVVIMSPPTTPEDELKIYRTLKSQGTAPGFVYDVAGSYARFLAAHNLSGRVVTFVTDDEGRIKGTWFGRFGDVAVKKVAAKALNGSSDIQLAGSAWPKKITTPQLFERLARSGLPPSIAETPQEIELTVDFNRELSELGKESGRREREYSANIGADAHGNPTLFDGHWAGSVFADQLPPEEFYTRKSVQNSLHTHPDNVTFSPGDLSHCAHHRPHR